MNRSIGVWLGAAVLGLATAGCDGGGADVGAPKGLNDSAKNAPVGQPVMPGMENIDAMKKQGVKASAKK